MRLSPMLALAGAMVAIPTTAQDYVSNASFGTHSYEGRSGSIPYRLDIAVSGTISLARGLDGLYRNSEHEDAIAACGGMIEPEPTALLEFTAREEPLVISAESRTNPVLFVLLPDGTFQCRYGDGRGNLRPSVVIDRPETGTYKIWVGTNDFQEEVIPGVLQFSTIGYSPTSISD